MSINLTHDQLQTILPRCDAAAWIGPVSDAMAEFGINTPARCAMFLAQTGHESAHFTRLEENLNYKSAGLRATFEKYFPTLQEAQRFAGDPERIANRVYANRMGNGPAASGDGWKFRGRGLIQLTGREMYTRCGERLRVDLIGSPELLTHRYNAARSAAWYFTEVMPGITLADARNLEGATRRINGGLNGIEERRALYATALRVLG